MTALAYTAVGFALATVVCLTLSSMMFSRRSSELAALLQQVGSGRLDGVRNARPPRIFPAQAAHDAIRALGTTLEHRQREIAQREQLLGALVEGVPMACVLLTSVGRVLHTNGAARDLFFDGRQPEDGNFLGLLSRAPEALRRAIAGEGDELFSIDDEQGRQVYQLAKRHFDVDGEPVVLVVVNNLTRELHRQEAGVWKRMIRIMAHELNNSLAPIISMVHSARTLARGAAEEPKLSVVFDTVAERAEHLRSFLEGYAQFARLPAPRKVDVAWEPFLAGLKALFPSVAIDGALPETAGWFDPAQMQQVLINLLKNAEEAGGPVDGVSLLIAATEPGVTRLVVRDRGRGMTAEIMKNALVPFYSTKAGGTGLGLPLCREIVEAHGGVLRLESRDQGGLDVVVRLPARNATSAGQGKLTLTRS